jgi:uncharacterized damage-inducible protein DinB
MNKEMLDRSWDHTRQVFGIYLRLLEAFPEDRFFSHPVPDMRTPAELSAHMSGTIIRDIPQGVAKGEITADESSESEVAVKLGSKAALIKYAEECWELGNAAVGTIGDDQLSGTVSTPWNMTFPGWIGFLMLHDEFLHHRGQLFAFARVSGVAPPFIWSFAENAPAYRPSH